MANIFQRLFSSTVGPFSLRDLDDFPYSEYTTNLQRYAEDEEWFLGDALDETIEAEGTEVDKYPIRVNPIYNAVLKHSYALFGEFPDDVDGYLVEPRVRLEDGTISDETERVENVLTTIAADSNNAAQEMEAGIMSQIYGGVAWRVAYMPQNKDLTYKIKRELLRPHEFLGIPFANDPWNLKEAWLIRKITARDAEEYGVKITGEKGYYIEHWTQDEYSVTINNSPLLYTYGQEVMHFGGENLYKFVPFVYIPHTREGGFYGDSLIRNSLRGLTREINARLADAGDAVSDDTHLLGTMKNVRGTPRIVNIGNGIRLIDAGSSQAIVGGEAEPNIEFPRTQTISDPTLKLNQMLYEQFRRESMVPAVADGEDEGSQRSALTLSTRMWPLVSHTKMERVFWSTGLRVLNRMTLKMLAIHNEVTKANINQEHLRMKLTSKWYPILPRDREQLINEIAIRAANNIGSLEHLLSMVGDVDNVDEQIDQIKNWLFYLASLEQKDEEESSSEDDQNA